MDHLLNSGADVHQPNTDGLNALHSAAVGGHDRVASRLLEAGADLTVKISGGEKFRGMTAREVAEAEGNHEAAALLAAAEHEL